MSAILFVNGILCKAAGADTPAPSISLADTTIRIPSGEGNWTRKDILIKGDNLDPALLGDNPTLSSQDLYVEGPTDFAVTLKNVRPSEGNGKSRLWLGNMEISKLPTDSSFKRRILFTYGKVIVPFDYVVTNRTESAFAWSVKPALKELLLDKSRTVSLAVSTGDAAATNVHVALSSLQDETTKDSLGREYLHLCLVDGDHCNNEPFSLSRHTSSQPLTLTIDDNFSRPGIFKGMVWIGVDQKQDPDSFELTVYSTRICWQILGTACICLGVGLWWFVAVFARQKAARAEALTPLVELRETTEGLVSRLSETETAGKFEMRLTRGRLAEITDELAENAPGLSALIPPKFPSISGIATDTTAGLKQYIDTRAAQIAALSILIRQGGMAILSKVGDAITAGNGALIHDALQKLDDAAVAVNTVDEARAKLKEIITSIEENLARRVQQDAIQAASGAPFVAAFPTTKELRLESMRLSLAVWAIWGVATVIVGVAALILTNHGFGTTLDYIKCFLWGLSIQAVGQQLQQLNPGSVTTSLKITVPK